MKRLILLVPTFILFAFVIYMGCSSKSSTSKEVQLLEHYDTTKNATLIYFSKDGYMRHMKGSSVLHGYVKMDTASKQLVWAAPPQQGDYLDSTGKKTTEEILQALVKQQPAPIPPPNYKK